MKYDNELRQEKLKKREKLLHICNPYPYSFSKTHTIEQIKNDKQNASLGLGEKRDLVYSIAGRMRTLRNMGKASFLNLQDETSEIQVYFRNEEHSETVQKIFELMEPGDFAGVTGFPFKTKKGELTIHAQKWEILSKSIQPMPEKYHGLQDTETRYRQRHLDLIQSTEVRKILKKRAELFNFTRSWLNARGFIEIDTPILQPLYGGAFAHPFETFHRTLEQTLYLKISPELYLKRLIIGGFEKVYEISKNFRNEGVDRSHNPEFTMLEWYETYTDYVDQMERFENLVCDIFENLAGGLKINYLEHTIDFSRPWKKISVLEGLSTHFKNDIGSLSREGLLKLVASLPDTSKKLKEDASWGEVVMHLFENTIEPTIIQPTFVMDHPKDVSPLTKVHRKDPRLVERFEPFCAHMEIGNSFSELNDPVEQRDRLQSQLSERKSRLEEEHPMDEDFLFAMEAGMPPTGGVGLGLDRILMILCNQNSIREIIPFPMLRTKVLDH